MPGNEFLDRLLDMASGRERIVVVGQIDTGKSTLVMNLADRMDAYVLDADIGQNDIGPPAVVSLGERIDGRYRMIDGYFCGSPSPSGHFMQLIAGVSRMLPERGKRPVLINTSGLVTGEIGRTLKTEKLNAIRPDMIIGLETGNELKYLDAFSRAGAMVVTFRPHPQVTSRSRSERERLRIANFRTHFQGAFTSSHRLDKIGIERSLLGNGVSTDVARLSKLAGAQVVHAEVTGKDALVIFRKTAGSIDKLAPALDASIIYYCREADFPGTLVGLINRQGSLLSLGIIESVDFERGDIRIYSPAGEFSVLQFGSVKLDAGSFVYAGPFKLHAYRHKH